MDEPSRDEKTGSELSLNEEMIRKDLEYTYNAYLGGEQVYPGWESIYALIVSGFFIVHFTAQLPHLARVLLSFIGLWFSLNWVRLVSRNDLYAHVRISRIELLEKALQQVLKTKTLEVESSAGQKVELILFDLMEYQRRLIEEPTTTWIPENVRRRKSWWSRRGTWVLRKDIPRILLAIWGFVLLLDLLCALGLVPPSLVVFACGAMSLRA